MVPQIVNAETNIKYIIHIADIHIRNFKRHIEYNSVFKNLYASCKDIASKGNTIIYLAGDIVHAKTDMSPELIEMTSGFFNSLANIATTIVITGNHDINLNNTNRLDALTPIIDNIKHPNLYYLKKSGLYQFGNILFGVQSIYEDKSNWPVLQNVKKDSNSKIVALFHGPVAAAKTDVGYAVQGEEYTVKQFSGYDLALLGDIHRMQYMNPSKTIAYAGSLIQQNHGESLDHGFMLWDVENKTSEFVKVENEYGFFTIDISGDSISDYSQIPARARLRLKIADADPTFVREFITKLKQKVKVEEITVINKAVAGITQMQGQKINFGDLRDVNVQNVLIKDWLFANSDIDNDVLEEVFKINLEHNKKLPLEEKLRNVIWTPKQFDFANMFSYGLDNTIDFSKMHGVYGMFASNAQGKSSIVDSLLFNLFNKSSRAYKASSVINNQSKDFYCKLNFEINGNDYFIERIGKRYKSGHVGVKANFWQSDATSVTGIKELNGTDKWGTDDVIASYIGDFEDFVLTSLSVQGKNTTFIDKSQTEKKDILIRFIELLIFDKLYELSNESFKAIASVLKEYEKKNFDEDLETSSVKFKKEEKEYTKLLSQKEKLQEKKKIVTEKILNLSQKLIRINSVIRDISVLEEQEESLTQTKSDKSTELNELDNILVKLASELKVENEIIDKIGSVDSLWETYQEKQKEYDELYSEIEKVKIDIGNKIKKLKNLELVKWDPNCVFCMNNVFVKDAIATKQEVNDDKINISAKVQHCAHLKNWLNENSFIKTNKELIASTKKTIEKIEKNKINTKMSADVIVTEINTLDIQLKEIKDEINRYYQNEKDIEHNKKIQESIVSVKSVQNDIDALLSKVESKILVVYSEMMVAKNNIDTIQEELKRVSEYEKQYRAHEYYLKAIQRDGIPYDLITKIIPILEQEVNSILSQIVDFNVLFELDDSKNINVKIAYDESKIWPLELASGMEKFVSGLAIRVALCKISSLPRPNILIVDEGWDTLDSDNLNSLGMLFEYLKTQYEVIIVISHIDSMRDMVDGLIEIKKDGEFSKVEHTN